MAEKEIISLGRLEEYSESIPWAIYVEKIEFYFSANNIKEDERKKNILLSSVGTTTFSILRDIIVPNSLKEINFEDLLKRAQEHFAPRPSEIVERFKFQKRLRKQGEKTQDFVRDLRRLSEFCNFGNTLDERLRDQLVFGIQNEKIQQKLLDTKTLTFQAAVDIAESIESAEAGVKSLHISEVTGVNKVKDVKTEVKSFAPKPKLRRYAPGKQNSFKEQGCYRCARNHQSKDCPFINAECFECHRVGHLKICCRNKNKKFEGLNRKKYENRNIKVIEQYNLNYMTDEFTAIRWDKSVSINGYKINFEIDSGAAHTIVSKQIADKLFSGKPPLFKSEIKLQTYTKNSLTVLGELIVNVLVDDICIPNLKMLVIKEQGPSLIGKTWLKASKLFWPNVNMIQSNSKDDLIRNFPNVFADGIGTIKGPPVSITLKNDAKPVFLRSRPIPFSLRNATDLELERLTREGIIRPVDYSDWASPVVIVPKSNGTVRICGDYRATVNANTESGIYPLPRMEELFSKLAGSKFFTVFDLKDAYLQQPVDVETSKILTLNTHKGLFNVLRLSFGVKCAPFVFQRKIENILKKFDYAGVFLDDVIISAKSESEHSERVECIMKCFSEHGIRLNKEKLKYMVSEVSYLGHRISQEGIKPIPEKVDAIMNAPLPLNVSQLRSFLGLISYYRNFLPNISDVLEPLHRLLDKNVKWAWSEKHDKVFHRIKQMLCKYPVLVLYDVNKDVVLNCDASEYGIGCVLSQIVDGDEKPIAFASRTMNKTERNYAMIDKEALAIVFGITKFHQYLAGKKFKIITDHKPLLRLFNSEKKVPDTLSPRMLRWSLMLAGYDYTIEYREGSKNNNADALSRLPLPETVNIESNLTEVMFVSNSSDWPVTSETIAKWTDQNPVTKQILEWVLHGWPNKVDLEEYKPYFFRREEISCLGNCLLWGHRVIIPDEGREHLLNLLHAVHQGICSMKAKARSVIWWPNMDKEIEQMVHSCSRCQMVARDKPKVKPLKWKSEFAWKRIHIDHAGPFEGKLFLLVVDSYSKWLEVQVVPSTDSKTSIGVLRKIFATFGLPVELVSDNGRSFTSDEFEEFMKSNGIKHILIPPYHPSSNGQAERYVQTMKNCLKKLEKNDINLSISRFLLENHSTPHSLTGKTPAELMFGRSLRTALHLVVPSQTISKQPLHKYKINESVFVKNFGRGEKWIRGEIIKLLGSRWVLVNRSDGIMCKRHINQLRCNRELSYDMTDKVKESGQNNNLNNYDNSYDRFYRSKNLRDNENVKEQIITENVVKSNQAQSSHGIVTGTVVNKNCDDFAAKNLNDNPVTKTDVDLKKSVQRKDYKKVSQPEPIRRSTRLIKPVVRLNYEGRGVISQ